MLVTGASAAVSAEGDAWALMAGETAPALDVRWAPGSPGSGGSCLGAMWAALIVAAGVGASSLFVATGAAVLAASMVEGVRWATATAAHARANCLIKAARLVRFTRYKPAMALRTVQARARLGKNLMRSADTTTSTIIPIKRE